MCVRILLEDVTICTGVYIFSVYLNNRIIQQHNYFEYKTHLDLLISWKKQHFNREKKSLLEKKILNLY